MRASLRNTVQLPVLVFSQFAGTSLWFAGNAILPDIQARLGSSQLTGWITSAVQLGFIVGTLLYALFAIPDRYRASIVFLLSAILAAVVNVLWLAVPLNAVMVLTSRFLTGFFLAGVYPVGMKIAADRFRTGLGRAMGFLVGALVLGTAFPHLLRLLGSRLPYPALMLFVSTLAVAGGVLLAVILPSDPPAGRLNRFQFGAILAFFRPSAFRPAMLGYFGHMWELYTFWAFLPALIGFYNQQHPAAVLSVSGWAFLTIASGAVGCAGGGIWALSAGSASVARRLLASSGGCILLLPFLLWAPPWLFGLFLLVWGITVAGDSPQFSTLVASRAPTENRGSVLALVTSVGFLITVLSIQLMAALIATIGLSGWLFYVLLPGPLLGLLAMKKLLPTD